MAAGGVRLVSFCAPAALCSPSRAGLLTGRCPIRTHIANPFYPTSSVMDLLMDVLGRYAHGERGIPEEQVLLAEALSRMGTAPRWWGFDHPGRVVGVAESARREGRKTIPAAPAA